MGTHQTTNSHSGLNSFLPSPCYNSSGYYTASNVSEYDQCASRFLSLGYNQSFGTSAFSVPPGGGYPVCFGFSPCSFSWTSSRGNNVTTGKTAPAPISSIGPAYLVINYNASQNTSIEIVQDVVTFKTSPSFNSSFFGGNFGYSAQETTPDYNFYVPINTNITFECLFLNNSTQVDSVAASFLLEW